MDVVEKIKSWFQANQVEQLCIDSRAVKRGDCFLAFRAPTCDRRDFIQQAIKLGAGSIIYEADGADDSIKQLPIAALAVLQLDKHLADIATEVYGNASRDLSMIGITGTNGKSSCVYYLAQAFSLLHQSAAMIGTVGNGFIDKLQLGNNTTPVVIELYQLLAEYRQQGAEVVAMEVSSHALTENRIADVAIDTAVFTQLSRDHLDYHGTMQAYAQAKKSLFEWPDLTNAVFNIDDPYGLQWANEYKERLNVIATSCKDDIEWSGAIVKLTSLSVEETQTIFSVSTPWGDFSASTSLLGDFNIANLLSVIAVLGLHNISIERMKQVIPQLQPAPGRMQVYGGGDVARVVVDYAHTPDALQKALQALRPYCKGQLWCVFGCGGDRDQGKRPQMAAAAEQYADCVIVTDDNPRTESAETITQAIMAGFSQPENVQIVHAREQAIALACQQAQIDDIILVAGKGHESYQIIGTDKIAFDDREVVQRCLEGE
ncbi:MAG: UDP-N-acetylmuramoyl-L-alanyl-D-glutamate--2,6-diaminopimelate ligase [Coxiellaceae bacterium]|nr:UDP-N-acetylmuramoyl-L-alanyl-D-glutamate--2,6-diaminopimelate ligase [Coxiellaceae bacterium]